MKMSIYLTACGKDISSKLKMALNSLHQLKKLRVYYINM